MFAVGGSHVSVMGTVRESLDQWEVATSEMTHGPGINGGGGLGGLTLERQPWMGASPLEDNNCSTTAAAAVKAARNRTYAQQSRNRRRQYVTRLEQERVQLLDRLVRLETENARMLRLLETVHIDRSVVGKQCADPPLAVSPSFSWSDPSKSLVFAVRGHCDGHACLSPSRSPLALRGRLLADGRGVGGGMMSRRHLGDRASGARTRSLPRDASGTACTLTRTLRRGTEGEAVSRLRRTFAGRLRIMRQCSFSK